MTLLNSAKRSRMAGVTITQDQGGGSAKKAGFPSIVGRDSWVSIYYKSNAVNCCKLYNLQTNLIGRVNISRGVGMSVRYNMR
jgi:hypothetical protein